MITIIIIIPKIGAIIVQYLNIENDCDIVSCRISVLRAVL